MLWLHFSVWCCWRTVLLVKLERLKGQVDLAEAYACRAHTGSSPVATEPAHICLCSYCICFTGKPCLLCRRHSCLSLFEAQSSLFTMLVSLPFLFYSCRQATPSLSQQWASCQQSTQRAATQP
jgi:hypothetical protein